MRATCSSQDIHELICDRLRAVQSLGAAIEDIAVRPPRRTAYDAEGCNWTVDIVGVPLSSYGEVAELVRAVRKCVNLPNEPAAVTAYPEFVAARQNRIIDSFRERWVH